MRDHKFHTDLFFNRPCKKNKDLDSDNEIESVQMIEVPTLDDDDEKYFEKVEKMIKGSMCWFILYGFLKFCSL